MWWLRLVQGIGLGGEVPLMAAYVNEFAKAEGAARFSLGIQCLFAIALTVAAFAGSWVVPHLGWQWMFFIGAVPALLVIPLRTVLPESPRWLASQGRIAEADAALDPPRAHRRERGQDGAAAAAGPAGGERGKAAHRRPVQGDLSEAHARRSGASGSAPTSSPMA